MGTISTKLQRVDWDKFFEYQTVKYVTIQNKKVGITHYILQFAIFVYIVVYTIIYEQRYLNLESPYGSVRATLREPDEWIPASTLPYCLQNSSSVNGFKNYNCTYIPGIDAVYPPGTVDSIFISTRGKDQFYAAPNCSDPFSLDCIPSKTPNSTVRFYSAGIEEYTLFMEHAIFGRQNQLLISNWECEGVIMYKNGSKFTFTDLNRTGDIMTIRTVLDAVGVASLDDASGVGNSLRYDGLLVIAVVTYNNYVLHPTKFHYTYQFFSVPLQDVISMQPSYSVPGGTLQRNWYGVRILYLVVGTIGNFDFVTLLTSLVSGMVLIKVATVIVDILLLYFLPEKKLYSKHKFEYAEEYNSKGESASLLSLRQTFA